MHRLALAFCALACLPATAAAAQACHRGDIPLDGSVAGYLSIDDDCRGRSPGLGDVFFEQYSFTLREWGSVRILLQTQLTMAVSIADASGQPVAAYGNRNLRVKFDNRERQSGYLSVSTERLAPGRYTVQLLMPGAAGHYRLSVLDEELGVSGTCVRSQGRTAVVGRRVQVEPGQLALAQRCVLPFGRDAVVRKFTVREPSRVRITLDGYRAAINPLSPVYLQETGVSSPGARRPIVWEEFLHQAGEYAVAFGGSGVLTYHIEVVSARGGLEE